MRILLILVLCLYAVTAYAGVEANVIKQDLDDNGNIRVWTQYLVDGAEVVSQYPKINGKYVFATRYSKQNFLSCKDDAEIEARILQDLNAHGQTLINQTFDKTAVKSLTQLRIDYNRTANDDFAKDHLKTLIGEKVTVTTAVTKIDSNNDTIPDKELNVKTDGTFTVSDITVVPDTL